MQHQILRRPDVERKRRSTGAVKSHARAVRHNRERLGIIAAVDLRRVDAVTTLEQIGAAAGIPDHEVVASFAEQLVVTAAAVERVVARTAEQQIVAAAALDRIVTGLAEQEIGTRAARNLVVAVAAEDVHRRHRAVGFVDGDRVVAALTEDVDLVGVGDGGIATGRFHRAVVDQDATGLVAADHNAVIRTVAEDGELARNRGKKQR